MRRNILAGLVMAFGFTLSSCVNGMLYQHTVVPLSTDFKNTPAGERTGNGDVKRFRYSVVDINWDTNAIGDIAKKAGLEEVYFADIETLRILGIWTQTWVHIYGK